MSKTANLFGKQAARRVKVLTEKSSTCLLMTRLTQLPLSARPMHTLQTDEEGHIWFFSAQESEKIAHILTDNRVQLFYAQPETGEFLSLYGSAKIIKDAARAGELWNAMAGLWFSGPDDPAIAIIKISPEQGYYWNQKSNREIHLLKITTVQPEGKRQNDSGESNRPAGQSKTA